MNKIVLALLILLSVSFTACSQNRSVATPQEQPTQNKQVTVPQKENNLPGKTKLSPEGITMQVLSTAEDLVDFSEFINQNQEQQPADIIWTLENDIDLTGIEWIPIGVAHWEEETGMSDWKDKGFSGVFDGQNHRIIGLELLGKEVYTTGFFGKLCGTATIKNLHVQGDVIGENNVGGLVGMAGGGYEESQTIIENCSFTGTVNAISDSVGGLIGCTGERTQVIRCYADAQVTGGTSVGGLIGTANNESSISDSYCRGVVNAQLPEKNELKMGIKHQAKWGTYLPDEIQLSMIGGFAGGTFNADINRCYSDVIVNAYAPARMLGAFIGYYSGRDNSCYYNAEKNANWKIGYAYSGTDSSFTAKPLNNEQFKLKDSFAGFDFDTVWAMDNQNGTPVLINSNNT
ncbi:MAG: GLUG motif-containing protein [Oscillospiraceae bacterium]